MTYSTELPRWRSGEPDAPGFWFVESRNGDLSAWMVDWDQDDDARETYAEPYLRFYCDGESEPIKGYPWPPVRSYGPIPKDVPKKGVGGDFQPVTLDNLVEAATEYQKLYLPCMSMYVCEHGKAVELILDTGNPYVNSEHIPGEGGDICIYRDPKGKVAGFRLPLKNHKLSLTVPEDFPVALNDGFLKADEP